MAPTTPRGWRQHLGARHRTQPRQRRGQRRRQLHLHPDADYHGPDSFTYTLTDADGDVSTATALLTVNPIDDLPVAVDDTFLTDEDSALTGQTLAPTTPLGDGGNTWALATGPSHGSVVVNADGSFTYTPDADYHGPDSFTYTLTDADGDVSTATALLTVNPSTTCRSPSTTPSSPTKTALTGQPGPQRHPSGMAATPGRSPPDPATAPSWSTPTAASPTPRTPTTTAPTASPTP
ncbi:MAG: tandem-95 repeat protein [Candidatus Accumulibacter sp.]|nr:tandem-95 repeat protein [Candidatus Accumulibacter propinquus]